MKTDFGVNLKKLMGQLDMTQVELANKTGMTPAAVSQILNNIREPSVSTVVRILMVIPVKFEKLVTKIYD